MILAITSCSTPDEADRIASALVDERLAACVQIHAARSVYRWAGHIERTDEWTLHIKTREALADAVRDRIAALHSYDLPEFIALRVETASADYAAWIEAETKIDDL
ncbi:MAG: divalent-cation tolerance protein CutA [Rhizorhabdus sp.]|uniref:divalent-cation tolerance protein CutA n=1 Tax=Rhizorhabdus sp. TaxID=1968843 RepID=UPI001B694011|nr:divalent-cation tolerance protein CutA [Rhizorhabdus sp.]MBP8234804.1 divalent-cation tolerance protein CutA [Rhizorhabdus sp.]